MGGGGIVVSGNVLKAGRSGNMLPQENFEKLNFMTSETASGGF